MDSNKRPGRFLGSLGALRNHMQEEATLPASSGAAPGTGHVVVPCPRTGQTVLTGLLMDRTAFEELAPDLWGEAGCPHCGLMHDWQKRQAHWVPLG